MTEFNKLPVFKLGLQPFGSRELEREKELNKFRKPSEQLMKKPIIRPRQPEPNIFFTPIPDNRDQVLERMKKELEYQLEVTKYRLPPRS